jgi:uncharacterized protein
MGKVLGWLVVALVAWLGWKLWTSHQRRQVLRRPAESSRAGRQDAADGDVPDDRSGVERMVRCAHCDLHLPASQARFASGKAYCSEEHQRLSSS